MVDVLEIQPDDFIEVGDFAPAGYLPKAGNPRFHGDSPAMPGFIMAGGSKPMISSIPGSAPLTQLLAR